MKLTFALIWLGILKTVLIAQEYQLSKPLIFATNGGLFDRKTEVKIDFRLQGAQLFYTLDGSEPDENSKLYTKPLVIKKSSMLKVKAYKEDFYPSETASQWFQRKGIKIASIDLSPTPEGTYQGNGIFTLIDGTGGTLNFHDGNWLGYNKGPITVVVELEKAKSINEIILCTLLNQESWIMAPEYIKTSFSNDGIQFFDEGYIQPENMTSTPSSKVNYSIMAPEKRVQYIKLEIQPCATLPDWHPGKGQAGWLFLDEIIVR